MDGSDTFRGEFLSRLKRGNANGLAACGARAACSRTQPESLRGGATPLFGRPGNEATGTRRHPRCGPMTGPPRGGRPTIHWERSELPSLPGDRRNHTGDRRAKGRHAGRGRGRRRRRGSIPAKTGEPVTVRRPRVRQPFRRACDGIRRSHHPNRRARRPEKLIALSNHPRRCIGEEPAPGGAGR